MPSVGFALLAHEPQVPEEWFVPRFYADAEGHRRARMSLLEQHRPVTAGHVAPELTLTHGEPLDE